MENGSRRRVVGRFRRWEQVERSSRKTNTEAIDNHEAPEEPRMEQDSKFAYQADAKVRDAHNERLMDEALMDTFPASDPIAPMRFD
ncbi:hypothetical protein [Burkholderia sp. Ac-20365]|uniref:hypothetical protein n=1 Tax=Burkholderia sp. Ac-20365 TaxID=2703897 RepID=UPI00197B8DE2|nr:hypothetical protein [Burkholderia sp. Ac-20365]MBN3764268.1 hypothetical protein [Burkholderia sp. Ac-20365]